MMRTRLQAKVLLLALLLGVTGSVRAQESLGAIKHFSLMDQMMINHTLSEYEDRDYLVLYIQGSGCPIARNSVPAYQQLWQQYRSRNVAFVMLNVFVQDDMHRIQKEVEMNDIRVPVLKDEDQTVAWSLGVERTAEVFIIEPRTREVLYRGPISDQFSYEVRHLEAREEYLADALETLYAGGVIDMNAVPDTSGCLVGYFHPRVMALRGR
jgi:peroxiredoxin